jgi:hypothetical protein
MTITPEQAGIALQSIEDAARHSTRLYRYRRASPFFLVWGICWALAYTLSHYLPAHTGKIWLAIDLAGFAGTWLTMRSQPRTAGQHGAWKVMGAALVLLAFVAASLAVLEPQSGKQVSTFIALVLATAYTLVGLWAGRRLVAIGALVAAVGLAAFFGGGTYFNLWMAVAGGGGLIAVGLWLRRA